MSSEKVAGPQGLQTNSTDNGQESVQQGNMPDATVEILPVLRITDQGAQEFQSEIIRETPVTLFVNDKQIVTLLTIMSGLSYLAVGFLFYEGWIRDLNKIEEVRVDEEQGAVHVRLTEIPPLTERFLEKRMVGTSCGKATSFYNVLDAIHCKPVSATHEVSSTRPGEWMREFLRQAPLYRRTRGTHNVALYGNSGRIFFEQDIGRHNAVDRIVGRCLMENIDVKQTVMLTTGRLSSEMVIKAVRLGVPVLVSRSSPTSLAISLANRLLITIVGRVRGESMLVYTHSHRITTPAHPENRIS